MKPFSTILNLLNRISSGRRRKDVDTGRQPEESFTYSLMPDEDGPVEDPVVLMDAVEPEIDEPAASAAPAPVTIAHEQAATEPESRVAEVSPKAAEIVTETSDEDDTTDKKSTGRFTPGKRALTIVGILILFVVLGGAGYVFYPQLMEIVQPGTSADTLELAAETVSPVSQQNALATIIPTLAPLPTPLQGLDPSKQVVVPQTPVDTSTEVLSDSLVQMSSLSRVLPAQIGNTNPIFDHTLFGGSLVFVLENTPSSYDLTHSPSFVGRSVAGHVFEQLLMPDRYGVPQSDMSENWKLTDNIWSFQLRPGIIFHDGTPVTSQDVQASLERWLRLDPGVGRSVNRVWAGFHALDDRTFNIHLHESSYMLLEGLSRTVGSSPVIMPKDIIHMTPDELPVTTLTGTGPYLLDAVSPGENRIRLLRFDPYIPRTEEPSHLAGAKIAYIETLDAVIVESEDVRLASVVSGAADHAAAIPAGDLAESLNHADIVTTRLNRPGFQVGLAFNTLTPSLGFDGPGLSLRRSIQYGLSAQRAMASSMLDPRLWQLCPSLHLCGTRWEKPGGDSEFLYDQGNRGRSETLRSRAGYVDETIVLLNPTDMPVLSRITTDITDQLNELGYRAFEERTTMAGLLTLINGTEDWHIVPTVSRTSLYHPLTTLDYRVGRMSYPVESDTGFLMDQLREQYLGAPTLEFQQEVVRRMAKAAWTDPRRVVLGQYFHMTVHRNELGGIDVRDIPDGVAYFANVRWDDQQRRWEDPKPAPEGIRILTRE